MLALAPIALLAPFTPLDTITFDDGQTHVIDENDVDPQDDIVIAAGPNFTITTVRMVGDLEVNSVVVRSRGIARLEDRAHVTGDFRTPGAGAVATIGDDARVDGPLSMAAGSTLTVEGDAVVSGLEVPANADFTLRDSATITGDLAVARSFDVELAGGRVLGRTSLGFGYYDHPGTTFDGDLTATAGAVASFDGRTFGGDVVAQDGARITLQGLNRIDGVLHSETGSTAYVLVDSALQPTGPLSAFSGVIAGSVGGQHAFYSFERDADAAIVVERADAPTSTTVCGQSLPNSTGVAGHVTVLGGNEVSYGVARLIADDLPNNSFSFFFVGTELEMGTAPSGDICVGGNLGRFVGPGQVMTTGSRGRISIEFDTSSIPGNPFTSAAPGSTYYFQCWNRDVIAGFPGSRFTDTAAVTFQ